MRIDDKSLNDLQIFRSRDGESSIFDLLDYTKTKVGRSVLKSRFQQPLSDSQQISEVQASIRFLIKHDARFPAHDHLIRDVTGYLNSTWSVASTKQGLPFVLEALWVSLRYKDLLSHSRKGIASVTMLATEAMDFALSILSQQPPSELRRTASEIQGLIANLPLHSTQIRDSPWSVFSLDSRLRTNCLSDLRRLFSLLTELDALCAMAEATKELGLCIPEIVETNDFILEGNGIYHLFLEKPVTNPVFLSTGNSLMFLTGPNMAGKTTYLKSVSITAYLSHLGMGVPAKSFRIAPLDAIFTSLSPEDDLRSGLSYFMVEVLRVHEIAEVVAKNNRVFVCNR